MTHTNQNELYFMKTSKYNLFCLVVNFQIFRWLISFLNFRKTAVVFVVFNCISSLAQDGQLDLDFVPNISTNYTVLAIAQQNDNKILIGGTTGDYNNITRLNEDGSVDNSFVPNVSFSAISSIAIQRDNKILVAGNSPTYLTRLNEDGSLDTTFNFTQMSNGTITKVNVLPSGKIIIAGEFNQIENVLISGVARLYSDGSLDTEFDLELPPSIYIRTLEVQPDEKIIIAGQYDLFGTQYRVFRRYLSNGFLDTSFNGDESYYIYDIEYQNDGKIMITGPFTEYFGVTRYNVARVNSDGSLDVTFNSYNLPQNGTTYTIFDVSVLDDGKYILNGSFSIYNNEYSRYLVKTNQDGSIDSSFDIGLGPNDFIWETLIQHDGKVLIGGVFLSYDGTPRNSFARLINNPLSVQEYELKDNVKIYPTLVDDIFSVEVDGFNQDDTILIIYSLDGRLVLKKKFSINTSINIKNFNKGVYMLKIASKNQSLTTKIIKK